MIVIESGFAGTAYDLKTPRIAAFPLTGTVTPSTETSGFLASYAANQNTYQFWRPTALPATWEIAFSGSQVVSYFGIAAHNLGTKAASVDFQTWNGSAWVTAGTHVPTDDSPILFLCARKTVTKARIQITGSNVPDIGVIQFGDVTEFPQKAGYVGHRDYENLIAAEYSMTESDGGNVVGRYVKRRAQTVSLQVETLSETFKTTVLDPLITHMETYAVWVAPRPSVFPKSVAFGLTTGPIVPERTIANSAIAVSVQMEFRGHVA